ncbi:MAG: CaiB/BaiF CoA transferase family protein, partial [Candidatus Binatia bacterium]
ADLGADVVKVEQRESGDLARWMRVRFLAGDFARNPDFAQYFLAMNRGKRSVTADLKHERGKEVVHRLLARADVLLTNFRPGVLERLGFGYEALAAKNPRLVYAAASSWGPIGPWARRPSRDTLSQAASGVMAKTGRDSDPPLPAGILVGDHASAITLVGGILAALFARERTGRGQRVDVSIYGTMLAMQPWEILHTSVSGRETQRAGRGHQFLHGVWGSFRTSDGWICLAGVDDARWPRFCELIGRPDLVADPECDNPTRNFRGVKIERILDEIFPTRTTAEWMSVLGPADILATTIADYGDILSSEQARENGYVRALEHPEVGRVDVVGNPIGLSATPTRPPSPAPELGQHTEEVLLELGYDWEEIAVLRTAKAI